MRHDYKLTYAVETKVFFEDGDVAKQTVGFQEIIRAVDYNIFLEEHLAEQIYKIAHESMDDAFRRGILFWKDKEKKVLNYSNQIVMLDLVVRDPNAEYVTDKNELMLAVAEEFIMRDETSYSIVFINDRTVLGENGAEVLKGNLESAVNYDKFTQVEMDIVMQHVESLQNKGYAAICYNEINEDVQKWEILMNRALSTTIEDERVGNLRMRKGNTSSMPV